jgi:pimeloyl-ACP methyl ester carboxylesterase
MTSPKANLHKLGGTGPALLLIHGFGSDRFSWAANGPVLFDVATVWAVDLPGHGHAPDDVGDGTAKMLAHAVAAELSGLDGPAVIVGHSLGGAVALHLSEMVPLAVRRLVLIAPAGLGRSLNQDFLQSFSALETPEATQIHLENLVERKRLIVPAMVAHVLASLQSPTRRAALQLIAASLAETALLAVPAAIPVDLIWGDADTINLPPQDLPAAATTLCLPKTGHMPHMEAASKVNAVIRAAVTS